MGIILYLISIILAVLFLYFSLKLYSSVNKNCGQEKITSSPLPVSVVIAVKNEAKNINELINNLSGLNYPAGKLEIILIDDASNDNSLKIMTELTAGKQEFQVLKVEAKQYPGKKGALEFGISKAHHNFIMITDADCRPEKDWLLFASGKFSEGNDLIFGIAPFYDGTTAANKISRFENLRNSILSFGLAGSGSYYTAAARNFGFRKDSFRRIQGYANTTETLSGDDDLLIREAVKNNLTIGIMTSSGSKVYSKSKESLKEYFAQRSRHTKTSFYYLPKIKLLLGFWHLINILFLSTIILSFLNHMLIVLFLIKIFTDLFIVIKLQKTFGYNFKILDIISLQIIYELFLIINFFNAAVREDKWK